MLMKLRCVIWNLRGGLSAVNAHLSVCLSSFFLPPFFLPLFFHPPLFFSLLFSSSFFSSSSFFLLTSCKRVSADVVKVVQKLMNTMFVYVPVHRATSPTMYGVT